MITTNGILETGARGLKTFQVAIGTTSHNLTNVSTEGYTRQRAEVGTTFPLKHGAHIFGTGMTTEQVVRLRMTTLDTMVQAQTSELGRWSLNRETTAALETSFGEATDAAIGGALNDFWAGWQDLTISPEGLNARQALVDRSQRVVDTFHNAVNRLDAENTGLNLSITDAVADANDRILSIAELNREISRAEFGGQHANDLRDRRDLLVDGLSALTDINVVEQPNGQIDIDVNGDVLVSGVNAFTLNAVLNAATNHVEVELAGNPLAFSSGKFQGFVDSFAALDTTRAGLDELASALITEVNALHATGTDMNGNPAGAYFAGADAATIALDPGVAADASLVAASTTAAPGATDLALALAGLRDTKVLPGGSPVMTLNDRFNNLVLELGSDARRAYQSSEDFSAAVDTLIERRESISGVNMDEELTNLMAFQRAYEACARLVSTVDEMMDHIINRTGVVGR